MSANTKKERNDNMHIEPHNHGSAEVAYAAGRRDGLGVAALTLGIVTYLSLLGVEKAVLVIVLGALAIRGGRPGSVAQKFGTAAIVLGVLFIVTFIVVMICYRDKVAELFALLQKLS
jgi:hypothetical protein